MKPHKDMKMYTLRHSLFYIGMASLGGAAIGMAAALMGWSRGLVYAVAISTTLVISLMSVRESLFAPAPRRRDERRPKRHT